MRIALALVFTGIAVPAFAQDSPRATPPAWSYPEITTVPAAAQPLPKAPGSDFTPVAPSTPIPDGLPERTVLAAEARQTAPGQQHVVYANLGLGQPSMGRVGVRVWARPQNSLYVEGFAGSALWNTMYGFGVRMQHTAWTFRNGDSMMLSPGAGVTILPNWDVCAHRLSSGWGGGWEPNPWYRNTLYFVYADLDVSWLHDFGPHFGFELGWKVGIAGLTGGELGKNYPRSLMLGQGAYPFVQFYSGFRF